MHADINIKNLEMHHIIALKYNGNNKTDCLNSSNLSLLVGQSMLENLLLKLSNQLYTSVNKKTRKYSIIAYQAR